ncbi:uncharacterized protein [Muntiacus reevesi]|uniref:uncharacterized protein n=1 Tax=Muntiacus reevesi TaxID=9886 RepID=UPI003306D751
MCSTPKESLHTSAVRRSPDSSHCRHRSRLYTPPPQTAALSLFASNRGVGEGAETVSRNAEATARLLRVSMPPLFAASELRYRLRLSPLRPLSVTASRSGKMAADGGGRGGGGGGRGGGAEGEGTKLPAAILLMGCRPSLPLHGGSETANWRQSGRQNLRLFHNRCIQQFTEGAEAASVRRLRAPDKSGAVESSAVSMEERETEEVGGRSSWKNTATVSTASLPPCIGGLSPKWRFPSFSSATRSAR